LGIFCCVEVFQLKGWGLTFHPDLLRGTALGQKMREYTFFSYEVNEALRMAVEIFSEMHVFFSEWNFG